MTIKSTIINDTPQSYHVFDKAILNSLEAGCDSYIVYNSNIQDFLKSFDLNVQVTDQKIYDRKFIFILDYIHVDTKLITNLLASKVFRYIPDFIIIYPDCLITKNNSSFINESTIDEVTYKIITREMDDPELVLLDYWYSNNQSFLYNNNLFPRKVKNLYKMQLNVSSIPIFLPYILLEKDVVVYPNKEPETLTDGIEIQVFREFANRFNLTLYFSVEPELWGSILLNGNRTGLFGNIIDNKFDASIGTISIEVIMTKYVEYASSSVNYRTILLVPSPRPNNKIQLVLLPFTASLWIAVILTIVMLTITFNIVSHKSTFFSTDSNNKTNNQVKTIFQKVFTDISKSFYIIYRINVLQSIRLNSIDESNFILRILLVLILLLAILISTAYCGGLSAILTFPQYEKSIRTRQDLLDSKMEWGANYLAWFAFLINTTDSLINELLKTSRIYSIEELENLPPRSFAYLVDELNDGSIAIPKYIPKRIPLESQLMQEDMYSDGCHAIFRKSSPFLREYNQFVNKYRDAGILLKIQKDMGLKYHNLTIQQHLKTKGRTVIRNNSDPVTLTVYDLLSVFILWFLGIIISCISFGIERLNKRRLILRS